MMNLGPEYPELLEDMAAQLRLQLVAHSLPGCAADEIARAITEHIRHHFGGQTIYVPTGRWFDARQEWELIWAKFNGKNVTDLARSFNKTESQIYSILRQMREKKLRELQPDLLPD